MAQDALFDPPDEPSDREADLVGGVQETLDALEESEVLDARHRGLVELLRAEARDYTKAKGIARTNYARLIGDHLTMLLDMDAAVNEEKENTDDSGDRVTKLAEFLQARRLGTDVRDTEEA